MQIVASKFQFAILRLGFRLFTKVQKAREHPPKELLKFPNWRFAESAKLGF